MSGDVDIVYRGARGSNTGDAFHELWAARQCLQLLDPATGLVAVKVEGTQSEAEDHFWDSADCCLYFGGTSNADAERIEIQQLKYSAANPEISWTVARLAAARDGKPGTSVIGGLAKAYKQLREERPDKPAGSLSFSLVSNQGIHDDLKAAIDEARKGVPPEYDRPWKNGDSDLHRLVQASGLRSSDFGEFAALLDLVGSTGSRFAIEDSFLSAVSEWTDVEFAESAQRIRTFVRQRMMPEAAGELINRDRLLAQFDISDERALFPCPPAIKQISDSIPREVAGEIAERLLAGGQRLCLHGRGGVGKTTVLQQLERLLPHGSQMVVFDCYGGGSYLDASALRHRPADAFVQLSNDLASRLRLPMLLDRRGDIDYPRAFRRRLEQAAGIIARTTPGALLVVSIDAADNSIAAARARVPADPNFVHDIQSFQNLPDNVRLLVSARTGRLPDLQLPVGFEEILLPEFTYAETTANVRRYWDAPTEWIDDFHHLSAGVPRVQAYAFNAPASTPSEAIDFLRPFGKKLDHIFRDLFEAAFKKLGQQGDLERVCAGLVALPRPIPIGHLAAILTMSESLISDVCSDLSPGVRRSGDLLSFADEDFEAFVRDAARNALPAILSLVAERLLLMRQADQYCALHVAPLLLQAGREQELLNLVESEPEPAADVVSDPVVRHEIRLQRLVVAISVCRHAGDVERALRFVLIGAEAKNTEAATLSLLTVTPSLTAKFARDTGSRLILSAPHLIAEQGPLLLHLMAESATNGEAVAVRETRRRFRAWAQRRQDDHELRQAEHDHARAWDISEEDASCLLYTELLHDGVPAAIERLRVFRPFAFAVLAAKALIERLASERRFKELEDLGAALPDPKAVFVLVPLAMAGRKVDLARLANGVTALKRRFKLDLSVPRETYSEPSLGNYYADTILCAAEILVARGGSIEAASAILSSFLSIEGRRIDRRYTHEIALIDAILRSYCLTESMAGREPIADDVLTPAPRTDEENNQGRGRSDRISHEQELRELISTLIGPYSARARVLSGMHDASEIEAVLARGLAHFHNDSWRFDRQWSSSGIRARLAENQTVLLATAAEPQIIMASAWAFHRGLWPHSVATMVQRLSTIEPLHEELLAMLTKAATSARRERIGAEDKSRNLAGYAKLITSISRSDAKVIFQQAIEVASELDSEAMDQIRLIDRLVQHAGASLEPRRRQSAIAFAEVFRDAAIRLENVDHFPWDPGFSALARLDFAIALSCAARWSDTDLVRLSRSIGPVSGVAVEQRDISSAVALALLTTADRPTPDNLQSVLASAAASGKAPAIAEEMARDILVDRLAASTEAAAFIERHSEGDWARRYVAQTQFEASLPAPDSVTTKEDLSAYTRAPRPTLQSQTWSESDLIDGLELAERAASVLTACREAGEILSLDDVLQSAGSAVPVGKRPEHLAALLAMQSVSPDRQTIEALLRAAQAWQAQPSVAAWCRQHIPVLITDHLADFARYLPWEDRWLGPAIELSGMKHDETQTALLSGIERSSEYLSAQVTFALVGDIGLRLDPYSAARLCEWYLDRLLARIPSCPSSEHLAQFAA